MSTTITNPKFDDQFLLTLLSHYNRYWLQARSTEPCPDTTPGSGSGTCCIIHQQLKIDYAKIQAAHAREVRRLTGRWPQESQPSPFAAIFWLNLGFVLDYHTRLVRYQDGRAIPEGLSCPDFTEAEMLDAFRSNCPASARHFIIGVAAQGDKILLHYIEHPRSGWIPMVFWGKQIVLQVATGEESAAHLSSPAGKEPCLIAPDLVALIVEAVVVNIMNITIGIFNSRVTQKNVDEAVQRLIELVNAEVVDTNRLTLRLDMMASVLVAPMYGLFASTWQAARAQAAVNQHLMQMPVFDDNPVEVRLVFS